MRSVGRIVLLLRFLAGLGQCGSPMSYKIEIVDEYSFGKWFSYPLRFATETEAEECSRHFSNAGWNGILDLRVVPSDEPVNASWTEKGVLDKDGQPIHRPPAAPAFEETQEEAKKLRLRWEEIVDRVNDSLRLK